MCVCIQWELLAERTSSGNVVAILILNSENLLLSNLSGNIQCIRSANSTHTHTSPMYVRVYEFVHCSLVHFVSQYKVYKFYDKSQIMFELNWIIITADTKSQNDNNNNNRRNEKWNKMLLHVSSISFRVRTEKQRQRKKKEWESAGSKKKCTSNDDDKFLNANAEQKQI